MRIRITIEYDPDWEYPSEAFLEYEKKAWRDNDVNLADIESIGEPNASVKWEIIP